MGLKRFVSNQNVSIVLFALLLCFFATGCKKKPPVVAAAPPPPKIEAPPPPPAAKPAISNFEAEPSTIERGQSSTLRWSVSGETTEVSIAPGVGPVAKEGNRQVFPSNSTTYTLTATGPGGSITMTANVNVTAPPAPAPPPAAPAKAPRTVSEILSQDVQDIYFDYDSSAIREDARTTLTRNADVLKQLFTENSGVRVVIEGHADERGSAEYNLGLSDRRASTVKEFMVQLGLPGDRLTHTSFGKERPQCTESTEACWQQNRRAHFSAGQ